MSTNKPVSPSGKTDQKAERAERLAAQLRANLKKRKIQFRDRASKGDTASRDDGESGQS